MTAMLTYSTTTGDVAALVGEDVGDEIMDLLAPEEQWEYCFVCHRATDHVGEHDDLVEAGLAFYTAGGSVLVGELLPR